MTKVMKAQRGEILASYKARESSRQFVWVPHSTIGSVKHETVGCLVSNTWAPVSLELMQPPSLQCSQRIAVISVEDAAKVLNLRRSAAYEACRRGQVPSRRIGRRIVVPVAALESMLLGIRDGAASAAVDDP
jgi:Helix-turn-helix domain